jgi:hypothetical protein
VSKKARKADDFGFGRSRSINDYRRNQGSKSPRKMVIIVCEGRETEPNYFSAVRQKFRLSTLNVKVVADQGAPISVVNSAIDEKKKVDEPTDEIWCIFDTENPNENPSLHAAIEKARKARINLAISNPSFEYWYFIHFSQSSRPFANGKEMKRALKVHIQNYDESTNVFPLLDEHTQTAIDNAEVLRQRSADGWDTFPNPSTGVDKLVAEIIEMASQKRY